jgi:hypothetical protein
MTASDQPAAAPLRLLQQMPAARADPSAIAELAQELDDGTLHCREHRGHNWRPSTVRREDFGFRRVEVCADCHSERWQEMDSRGYVIRGGIHYSPGYLNPKGTGRVREDGMAAYRLEALQRALPRRKRRAG